MQASLHKKKEMAAISQQRQAQRHTRALICPSEMFKDLSLYSKFDEQVGTAFEFIYRESLHMMLQGRNCQNRA